MINVDEIAIASILDFIEKDMVCCEVGVRSGESSEAMLKKGAFVYLIDCWEDYEGAPVRGDKHRRDYEETLRKIKPFKGKYKVIKKMANEAYKDLPDNLDFIYIDSNHEEEYVLEDIKNYMPKLKSGGYLAGDDVTMEGVNRAIMKAFPHDPYAPDCNLQFYGRNWIIKKR